MSKGTGNIKSNIPLVNTIAFRSLMAFALAFFVVLFGGAIFMISNQLNLVKKEAQEQNKLSLHQVMTVIEGQYDLFLGRLTLLATTPYIENQDPTESGGFLKGYNVAPLFIPGEHVVLYNSKHEKVSDNSMVGIARVNTAYHELKDFNAVEPQHPYISPLFWEQHTPKKIVAVLVENRAKANGFLAASFSFRRLWEIFESYKLGNKGFFVIVDESDVIVYHPNIRQWVNGQARAQDLGLESFNAKSFTIELYRSTKKRCKEVPTFIVLDEMNAERSEKKTFDITYAFVNQLETICRLDLDRRIILLGNTLEEGSDILANAFNFIPNDFGIYYLKNKRAVIQMIEDSDKYKAARKNSIAGILTPDESTFTNKVDSDVQLLFKGKQLPKQSMIIKFDNNSQYVLCGNVITKQKVAKGSKLPVIALKPYLEPAPFCKYT